MNRAKANYWIDIGLMITFLITFFTGVLKLPKLFIKFRKLFPKLDIKLFNFFHDWSGIVMGVLVLIHIILHWNWIVSMTKNIFKR